MFVREPPETMTRDCQEERGGLHGEGLVNLPLHAFHQRAKAQVEAEGRKDAKPDWSVLNLSFNHNLFL
jgi:hypothetical protein